MYQRTPTASSRSIDARTDAVMRSAAVSVISRCNRSGSRSDVARSSSTRSAESGSARVAADTFTATNSVSSAAASVTTARSRIA
jgi:hypothetical protein